MPLTLVSSMRSEKVREKGAIGRGHPSFSGFILPQSSENNNNGLPALCCGWGEKGPRRPGMWTFFRDVRGEFNRHGGRRFPKGKAGIAATGRRCPPFFSSETSEKHLGRAGDFSLFQERLTAQARNCLGGQACNTNPLPTGGKRLPILFRHAEAALTFSSFAPQALQNVLSLGSFFPH